MTERIRWQDEPEDSIAAMTGSVGAFGTALFKIYPPDAADDVWILTTTLPGWNYLKHYGDSADALKPMAERWLTQFAASLGATFNEED
jgi:hypothetical protein